MQNQFYKPGFFSENRVYYWNYPGYPGGFADYMAFSTKRGELAIYSLFQGDPLQPVQFGINNDDAYQPGTYYVSHNFGVMLKPYQLWESPLARFRVSKPWSETIMDYRLDNGLDRFPSIQQKIGSLYDKVIHMPEYRLVSFEVARKFSQYDSLFFSQLRTPGLLHLVGYQPIGNDHYSPDYLLPDTCWCNVPSHCTQEFADMFYPMAQMMSRDKTLFYQHNLDLSTFLDTKQNITWNLVMGYTLGDDLRLTEGNFHDNAWFKLNGE